MASAGYPHPPRGRAEIARILVVIAASAVSVSSMVTAAGASAPSTSRSSTDLFGMCALWLVAIATVLAWRRYEPLAGLGFHPVAGRDVLLALAAGAALMLAVPALALLAATVTSDGVELIETATVRPAQLVMAGVLTAAVTEEIVYRGAAMGALARAGAGPLLQVIVPAGLFTMMHNAWSVPHTIFVVLPLSVALGLLYLWRRSLPVTIIAHLVIDAPLVVLASAA